MQLRSMAAVALASGIVSSSMAADAVQWRVEDGGNGHWYQAVVHAPAVGWEATRQFAALKGGHLATISSLAENQFVFDLSVPAGCWNANAGPYLGAFKNAAGQFEWITGEPFGFTNWLPGEPSSGAWEPALAFIGPPATGAPGSYWNDYESVPYSGWTHNGSVIEFDADCNNDGIVDYSQCRDGSLPDYNGNNTPDCCEQGTSCVVGSYPVQWRSADGGNGHWYQGVAVGQDISWNAAKVDCESRGGNLATLTSSAEDDVAWALASRSTYWVVVNGPGWTGAKGPWLGLQQASGAPTAQGWSWVTGEPFTWAHPSFVPNDGCSSDENALNYIGPAPGNREWNDFPGDIPCAIWGFPRSYIIEWSADCNADGIVDYGQILGGELADTNTNGVPDTCESTILVPSQFPTIQAAIDSVPAGAQRAVQVAAGTYNESFSLNGKNILVRGAANNATILDGTGLATSIAKFTGGEPATAGVENLVFRNGTAGSRLTPKSNFTVGGAIFANTTTARIKDCRFENCRADFGGAVYQYVGTLAWDNCVFTGNSANAEGGAALTYNCTGSVRGCSFTANRCGLNGPGSGSAFKSVGSNGDGETVLLDTCTITGNIAGDSGSAVEHYEHTKYHPGVLRIVNTTITGNTSGQPAPTGAGGLRVLGRMQSCVLASGTLVCSNTAKNIDGPYFIEGSATVCGCVADITGDGVVNGGDLGVLLSNWGPTAPSGLADVTHDGVVDGGDLAVVLSSWGACN